MVITFITVLAGLVVLSIAAVYFVGISSATKRDLERRSRTTLGEDQVSQAIKDGIAQIPVSDGDDSRADGMAVNKDSAIPEKTSNRVIGDETGATAGHTTGATVKDNTSPLTGRYSTTKVDIIPTTTSKDETVPVLARK